MPYSEYYRTHVTTTPYQATGMDAWVGVNTASACTVKLPVAPVPGQALTVSDETGGAATANITLDGNGKNIDGAATRVINTAWATVTVLWTGAVWKTI